MNFLAKVHEEWLRILAPHMARIEKIEKELSDQDFNPIPDRVMRAFEHPPSEIKIVIFGQDPYPTRSHATGLAFSVPAGTRPLPKSLINIFSELHEDVGGEWRTNGDLTSWAEQGVALINRVLTVPRGQSGGHKNLGWQRVTDDVAKALGERGVIAILWGNYAQELSGFFELSRIISSPHPSPLSAHRGFFGSKPFSRANQLLVERSRQEVDWLRD